MAQFGKSLTKLNRSFAFKLFLFKKSEDQINENDLNQFKSMLTENKNLVLLNHENIISIIGIGYRFTETQQILGIVQPLMDSDLKTFLAKKKNIPFVKKMDISFQIVEGLRYIHFKEFSHNDVKPQNILVKETNGNLKVQHSDFGTMLKRKDDFNHCQGLTLEYAAPEILLAFFFDVFLEADQRSSDIWSLGLVLFCLYFGKKLQFKSLLPWKSDSLQNALDQSDLIGRKNLKTMILEEESKEFNEFFSISDSGFGMPKESFKKLKGLINRCLQVKQKQRPKIEEIIEILNSI